MRGTVSLLSLLCILVTLSAFPACSAGVQDDSSSQSDSRPSRVIWITIDALRAENLSFMGYNRKTSPWMDEVARGSVVFDRAISPSHGTVLSVPSYMTGLYHSEFLHNAFRDTRLPDKFKMLAEAFKERGFITHWYTTNGNASRAKNHDQGIEHYCQIYPRGEVKARIDEVITVARLNYRPTQEREFIYIHLNDVHDPYRPPIPYDTMFGPGYGKSTVREGVVFDEDRQRFFSNIPYLSETGTIHQQDIDFLVGQYDGCIRYTDAKLPELLDVFNYDATRDLLIITADHGDQFYEHGFLAHGRSLRSQDFHVPLIMSWAGFSARRYSSTVSLLDLYPTLAELFGLSAPEGLRGTSLVPVLKGGNPESHYAVGETADWRGRGVVVVSDKYWYALNTQAMTLRPWLDWPYEELLFDLAKDPKCLNNLASELPVVCARLNKAMGRLHQRYAPFTSERIRRTPQAPVYGENLFDQVSANRERWGRFERTASVSASKEKRLAINMPRLEVSIVAPTDPSFKFHLFEAAIGLESGWLTLEMQRSDTGATLWTHQFRKKRQPASKFRRAFYPKSVETRLVVTMDKPGKATVDWPSLRQSNIDVVWPKRWPIQLEKPQIFDTPVQTEADKARMEALGYL